MLGYVRVIRVSSSEALGSSGFNRHGDVTGTHGVTVVRLAVAGWVDSALNLDLESVAALLFKTPARNPKGFKPLSTQ